MGLRSQWRCERELSTSSRLDLSCLRKTTVAEWSHLSRLSTTDLL